MRQLHGNVMTHFRRLNCSYLRIQMCNAIKDWAKEVFHPVQTAACEAEFTPLTLSTSGLQPNVVMADRHLRAVGLARLRRPFLTHTVHKRGARGKRGRRRRKKAQFYCKTFVQQHPFVTDDAPWSCTAPKIFAVAPTHWGFWADVDVAAAVVLAHILRTSL